MTFLTLNDQWIYNRINQKLKRVFFTYAQFSNLIFESLLSNNKRVIKMSTLIEDYKDYTFIVFMNDHESSVITYDAFFQFLYKRYFSRCAFESVYLIKFKTSMFANILKMLKFEKSAKGLRPFIKHQNKIRNWLILINKAELNTFL